MKASLALLVLTACMATAATEEKLARTFAVTSGGALVVDIDFGSIEVVADSARSEVSVEGWRKVTRWKTADEEIFLKENPVEFTQDGNTVTIRAHRKQHFSWSWFSGWHNRNEAQYTIHVPAEFSAKLETSGGAIAVSNVSGSVKADTSGGGLRFTNIHGALDGETSGGSIKVVDCSGEIRLETSGGGLDIKGGGGSLHGESSGGGITAKNFAGSIAIETSGGGITIENIQGKINGSTSGGPIHASFSSTIVDSIDLSTSGGGIAFKTPAEAAFKLDAEASGGGVNCDLPVTVQGKIEQNHLKGTVNAGGPNVRLRTSGGGIRVQKN